MVVGAKLYSICIFNQKEEHLGFYFMNIQILFFNSICLSIKHIFEMFPKQNINI